MVVIDNRLEIAHECLSKTEAARLVGVDRSTIHRWVQKGEVQVYNNFVIYIKTVTHKQSRGNGIPPVYRPKDYRRQ